jgi:hypothetical protein
MDFVFTPFTKLSYATRTAATLLLEQVETLNSPWISRLLEQLGHQVLVANTRKIRAITASESKNDRNDAEKLARFAAHDPRLLSPIRHRRWGLKPTASGGKRGKKRAIVAVARKLAVILHRMWRTGSNGKPFPQSSREPISFLIGWSPFALRARANRLICSRDQPSHPI